MRRHPSSALATGDAGERFPVDAGTPSGVMMLQSLSASNVLGDAARSGAAFRLDSGKVSRCPALNGSPCSSESALLPRH